LGLHDSVPARRARHVRAPTGMAFEAVSGMGRSAARATPCFARCSTACFARPAIRIKKLVLVLINIVLQRWISKVSSSGAGAAAQAAGNMPCRHTGALHHFQSVCNLAHAPHDFLALIQAARVPQRTPLPHAARPSRGRPARAAASRGPGGRAPVIVSPWQMTSVSSRYSTVCFQCVVRHLRAAQRQGVGLALRGHVARLPAAPRLRPTACAEQPLRAEAARARPAAPPPPGPAGRARDARGAAGAGAGRRQAARGYTSYAKCLQEQ